MLTWHEVVRLLGPKLRRTLMNKGSPDGPSSPVADDHGAGGSEPRDRAFSREELRALNEEISLDQSASVPTETMLTLVDIDPSHVQAYWQVQSEDLEAAQRFAGVRTGAGEAMVLKVHDALCMTMNGFIPWPPLEFEVTGLNGSKHIEVPDSGHTLVAELGLRGPRGSFIPLTWSRPVRLPPPGEAEAPDSIDLVVIDEPGNPPRVVEVLSAPSAKGLAGRPAASPGEVGSPGILEEPIFSGDLQQGVWSSGLPPGSWDEEQD